VVDIMLFENDVVLPPLRCMIFGLGIVLMLGVYGVVQERVMTMPYEGEYFKVTVFLVFCNRLCAVAYGLAMSKIKGTQISPTAPIWKYAIVSMSNFVSTSCQYEALKWVSFPVQMLGKSSKIMPVMLWGIAISQKEYSCMDWAIAAAVTIGVAEFLMTGDIHAPHIAQQSSYVGLLLLSGYLVSDGLTSTFQEKLFKQHQTSKYNQMLWINLGSAMISLMLLLGNGSLILALTFCRNHPRFMIDASTISGAAVAAQFFMYSMVEEFGALAFAAAMNLRQVISIVISYMIYSKPITMLQICGLTLVFAALSLKSFRTRKASLENLPLTSLAKATTKADV